MRALTALLTVLLVVCVAAAYTYQWKRIPIARNSVFVNSNQLPQQQQQQSCSYSYSNSYGYRSSYGNCYRLFSSNGLAFDNDYKDLPTIKEEIAIIIEAFLSEVKDINQPLNINPAVLIEFSYVLTKGKLYEEVMGELLTNAKDYIEVQALELVDNSMKNFVISERKSRARLKMNYILAGASSNRLEQSITILKESDEIDDDLLNYLESLIQKELMRAAGPVYDDEVVEEGLSGIGKNAIEVLRMVQRRLEAEVKVKNNEEVKLLADLLRIEDYQERFIELRSRLKKIESVEAFSNFLDAGVDHVASQSAGNDDRSDDPTDMSAVDRPFDSKVSKKKKKKTELPVGTLEKMKDIQKDVEQIRNMLKTGLKNEDYYSTLPEDYSPI